MKFQIILVVSAFGGPLTEKTKKMVRAKMALALERMDVSGDGDDDQVLQVEVKDITELGA